MSNKSITGNSAAKSRLDLLDETEQPKEAKPIGSKPEIPQTKSKRDSRINLALTKDLKDALIAEAESQGRSVNNLMENIIKQYLNR